MTSYHVRGLYDTNIGIVYPNDGVQFYKCILQGDVKY